ncbi:GNAT family N-acetyltransferase [Streptomyces spectabilis]|uniref:GNAT family N-acetyltransferase n=1 Tax=Streptomyces spectabilis TaxID=68270 RepID=UPI00340EED45
MHADATPEQSFNIRLRRDGDVAEAASVLMSVHSVDRYPVEGVDQPEAWIKTPSLIQAWVAVSEGRIVGHAGVSRPNGDESAALWFERSGENASQVIVAARLFVDPEARGMGVGKRLTETVMDYAEQHSVRLVFEVMTKDTTAIHLYEKLGFQKIGRIVHRYGEDQHVEAICYVWPTPERP